MGAAGAARRGHLTGGLAQVCVVLSALLGGISGSAVADAAMQSRFLGPHMLRGGYSKGFTCAILSFSSLIVATLPPSLGLIIFGSVANVSVGRLFVGGIVPGILMTIFMMFTTYLISRKRGYKVATMIKPTAGELLYTGGRSFWALLFPVILIVFIRMGLFTTSEAGAFAIVYALFIGKVFHKELQLRHIPRVLDAAITDIGAILLIITTAGMFGYMATYVNLPASMGAYLVSLTDNAHMLLFLSLLLLLVIGTVLESSVLCLIFVPILLPSLVQYGIDPVHFGLLGMTIMTMGVSTPPVGTAMFVTCGILKGSVDEYVRESWPYLLTVLVLVFILAAFPSLVLFLPNLIFG